MDRPEHFVEIPPNARNLISFSGSANCIGVTVRVIHSLVCLKLSKIIFFYVLHCDIKCFWCCWLGGRKGVQPVETEWCGTGVVICLERGADLHMAQLMPLPLASVKSRLVLPFWYRLTWVVPDKGPLNVCLNCFKTMLKFVHNCGTVKVVFCSRMSLIRLLSRWWPDVANSAFPRVVMRPWSSVWFLHHICSLVYILCFDNICFPSPHLSFFLHFFLPYLFFENRPAPFPGQKATKPDFSFFCIYFVLYMSSDWRMRAFVVLG